MPNIRKSVQIPELKPLWIMVKGSEQEAAEKFTKELWWVEENCNCKNKSRLSFFSEEAAQEYLDFLNELSPVEMELGIE